MWIFFRDGFVSIVAHRDEPDRVLVRARRAEHLRAFVGDGPEIAETPSADYRFRVVISRADAGACVLAAALAIDYPNFKNAIRDDELHDAATSTWHAVGRLQEGGPYGASSQGRLMAGDLFDDDRTWLDVHGYGEADNYETDELGHVWNDDGAGELCEDCGVARDSLEARLLCPFAGSGTPAPEASSGPTLDDDGIPF